MADITVQILENIRHDIAALDAKFEAKFDAMDKKVDGMQTQIDGMQKQIEALGRNLGRRIDETNERIGSMVSLFGHFVRREDDIDARLRALEAHVFGRAT